MLRCVGSVKSCNQVGSFLRVGPSQERSDVKAALLGLPAIVPTRGTVHLQTGRLSLFYK
jgi:hypothetical protein